MVGWSGSLHTDGGLSILEVSTLRDIPASRFAVCLCYNKYSTGPNPEDLFQRRSRCEIPPAIKSGDFSPGSAKGNKKMPPRTKKRSWPTKVQRTRIAQVQGRRLRHVCAELYHQIRFASCRTCVCGFGDACASAKIGGLCIALHDDSMPRQPQNESVRLHFAILTSGLL